MSFYLNLITFLWFVITIKYVLFWIYLWQLKEYHVGRFLDHFTTHKGRKLIFGTFTILKVILLIIFSVSYYLFPIVFYILLFVYLVEALLFIFNIIRRNFKKPILTTKTIFLMLVSFGLVALYFFAVHSYVKESSWFTLCLLFFDILAPLFVSFIVLLFQPFFVLARNNILKKAKQKISTFKNLTVIGITGSYGKTSTKEFLTTILSKKFNVLSTPEHKNSEIGIAQTILKDLTNKHQIFVVEMGSYNKGGIRLLCDIVKPKIGMVTGVNEQHLATFGSLENLLSAEGGRELVASLPEDGLIVLNGDNPYCLDLYKQTEDVRKKLYTVTKDKIDSDIWTEDINIEKDHIFFIATSREKELVHFYINILGRQNVQNMLGAILVARELGMSFEEIGEACKNIQQAQAGITLKRGIHGIDIIDSSYSSNPDGVMADLDYLNIFPNEKVIVMPCLIELGKKSGEIHYQIGKKIAEVCDLAIITTKDRFENIKRGAVENGMQESNILLCSKPSEALVHITTFCKEGDAVLLEGRVPSELIKLLKGK